MTSPSAAFFDVDGTLTRTTVLDPLVWYHRAHLSRPRFALWAARLLLQIPWYVHIDRRSRKEFSTAFFRRYTGLSAESLRTWHRQAFAQTLERRLFPAALECVRDHRRRGHRIVLVTGGLDFVMEPLAEHLEADELFAIRLAERDGVCTGAMTDAPVGEEQKAVLMREYARKHGIDLAGSFAYGDNAADVPMLEQVGKAVAVNPDRRLRALAVTRGWEIVRWAQAV